MTDHGPKSAEAVRQAGADDSGSSSPASDPTDILISGDRDPLDRVAEEFAERCRRGENPSLAEYEAQFPDQREKVRKLLGAVAMMEQLRRGSKQARFMPERIGEFRVLRELGRGGMGVVYEAVQESLWRHVAVKAIHHTQLDMKRLQRFQREAQAVAQLHHTNIVPIFGVGEHDGVPYYAMQYIRGRGLDALLDAWQRDGLLPDPDRWRLAARFAQQAAGALDYAHGQGVLHRDIKPANLLIDEHEAVWITDFGLAKMVGHDELTASGDVIGTLRYLAPESLRGISEARSDVYSLGLTLYEMITLRPPYGDLTPSELLHRVSEGQPVRPRQVDPSIPRDLETIILKATARDLKDRYASAAALADDLACFLNDRPIAARRANFVERGWRWSRRNRGTAALMALAATSITVAAIAGWGGYMAQTRALQSETARLNLTRENIAGLTANFLLLFESLFPDDAATNDREDIPLTQALRASGVPGRSRMFADRMDGPERGPGFGGGPRQGRGDRSSGPPDDPGSDRARDRGPGRDGAESRPPDNFAGGPPPDEGFGGGPGGPRRGFRQQQARVNLSLIKKVLASYDKFARSQDNLKDVRLQGEAGWVYYRLAIFSERSGDRDAAAWAFEQTLRIYDELSDQHPREPGYFARFLLVCSAVNPWQTDPDIRAEVEAQLERMDVIIGRLLTASPRNLDYLRARSKLLAKLGLIRYQQRRPGTEQPFRQALELADDLIEREPEEGYPHSDRSDVLEAFALVLENQGKRDEAKKLLDAAMADLEWVADDGLRSEALARRMESLADDFERLGDQARSDEIQVRADLLDPREPLPNRPKPGRPFGSRRDGPVDRDSF